MKKWYESKEVWLGVLLTVAGIADFIGGLVAAGPITWQSVTLIVSGVVAVILRVWFTSQSIERSLL